ncbi:tetraspanin-3-like [Elgaria multicarinata webbii]|uniref:tetraspanin-3-like n=1 Tax=Elgaria multicarinata webbii TaxID=159646 RepID=UPI002FCD2C66
MEDEIDKFFDKVSSKMKGVRVSPNFRPSLSCVTEPWSRAFAKVGLTLLGFFLWGAAVALLFGGAFVILTYETYRPFFQNKFFLVPGWLAIGAALLLFPAGALAMCTPLKNSRHQQGALMYLLLVLLCLEASSAVMTQIYSARAGHQLKNSMGCFFLRYNQTVPSLCGMEAVNTIHKQLKCCGLYNYTDWMVPLPNHLPTGRAFAPETCCKETYLDCNGDVNQPEKLFNEGCLQKLEERLHFVMHYLAWCCLAVGCLEMLAAISNGILMKEQPFQDFRILDSAAFS